MEGLLKGGSLSKDNISAKQLVIQITIIKRKWKNEEKKTCTQLSEQKWQLCLKGPSKCFSFAARFFKILSMCVFVRVKG